ncbi:MAG: NTP transferase domain-containing protein [Firmicutes bacterium]|nr:NTP transferase domain-containing protein [Bacillota bacterium]
MKAILPVAGVGTRLRPHTHTVPKALVPVAGKPILGHILDCLVPVGVDQVVLVVGHLGDKIVDYVRSHYRCSVEVVSQADQLGLGHAIHLTRDFVRNDEPVLIVLGDTIFVADLAPVVGGGSSFIGVKPVSNPSSFGVVELNGSYIRRLVEKPEVAPSNLAVVGVYFITNTGLLFECLSEILEKGIRVRGEYQLTDALELMIRKGGNISVFPVEEWYDCGSPATLLETNRKLLDKIGGGAVPIPGSIVIPPVAISPSARITNCVIGPYVSVAENAEISRAVVRDSIITESARVEDVLLSESLIGERAYVSGKYTRLNIGDSSSIQIMG